MRVVSIAVLAVLAALVAATFVFAGAEHDHGDNHEVNLRIRYYTGSGICYVGAADADVNVTTINLKATDDDHIDEAPCVKYARPADRQEDSYKLRCNGTHMFSQKYNAGCTTKIGNEAIVELSNAAKNQFVCQNQGTVNGKATSAYYYCSAGALINGAIMIVLAIIASML